MKVVEVPNKLTDDEYFLLEEKSKLKHELVEGNLFEMSGVSIFHNSIVLNLLFLLQSSLRGREWRIIFENYKIKTPEGNYFYPDVAVCLPHVEKYFSEQPVLICEVLSDATRKYDLTDKFILYQKIPTLKYYLCIEPEQQVIVFYQKQADSEWTADTLTMSEQEIHLADLNVTFSLKEVYNP